MSLVSAAFVRVAALLVLLILYRNPPPLWWWASLGVISLWSALDVRRMWRGGDDEDEDDET